MAPLPLIEETLCRLQKCRLDKDIQTTKEIHLRLCENGLDFHHVLGNHLVPTFIQCDSLSDAQQVFDRLPHPREVSWTSLMQGYVELGEAKNGFQIFERMHENSVYPSKFTFPVMLKACAKLGCVERGRDLHSLIVKNGLDDNLFIGNTLVDMYAKCGSLVESQGVFDVLPDQDLVSWNALITGYAENGFAKQALACFERLQCKGLSPDVTTFLSVLKACSTIQAEDFGKKLHAMILNEEFEEDVYLGNTLVDMYAKCALLEEARDVFEELPSKDLVSCNALITGHADHEHFEEVLSFWREMQLIGISPNSGTYVRVLQACSALAEPGRGLAAHSEIVQRGVEEEFFVCNTLVDMYSKCGLIEEAQNMFDKVLFHDAVSWNALIAGYSAYELKEDGLTILWEMQHEEVSPDSVTFSTILKACSSLRVLDKGREIHTEIAKLGFEDRFTGSSLVDLYAKCESLEESLYVFDRLLDRDVVCWNVLISGYAEQGFSKEAFDCMRQMQYEGVCLDPGTYVCILQCCTISTGSVLYSGAVKQGIEEDLYVGNALLDLYSKSGMLTECEDIFARLSVQDLVSWTSLIGGYTEQGLVEEALNCLFGMQLDGITPDVVAWNSVILGYTEQDDYEKPIQLCAQMLEQGILPDRAVFLNILSTCRNALAMDFGRRVHAQVVKLSKAEDSEVAYANAFVDLYGKCGSVDDAEEVFQSMSTRSFLAWNALLFGYALQGESKVVYLLFEQMIESGIYPDSDIFQSVFIVCSHAGLLLEGLHFHQLMREWFGITPTLKHLTCFVDLLARAGCLDCARFILERMPFQPDLVLLHAMLSACRMLGDVELGHEMFAFAKCLERRHAAAYILMANIYTDDL